MNTNERQNFKQNFNWGTTDSISFDQSRGPMKDEQNEINQANFNLDKLRFKNLSNSIVLQKEKSVNTSLKSFLNLFYLDSKKEKPTFSNLGLPSPSLSKQMNKIQTKINFIYQNFRKRSFSKVLTSRTKNIRNFLANLKLTSLFLGKKNLGGSKTLKREQATSLRNWQRSERALNKEKRSRKEFDLFSKKQFKSNSKNYEKYVHRKTDLILSSQRSFPGSSKETEPNRKKRDQTINKVEKEIGGSQENLLKKIYRRYFTVFGGNNFKRKKSPQRRSRISRNRGVTKKRTLSDSLRR